MPRAKPSTWKPQSAENTAPPNEPTKLRQALIEAYGVSCSARDIERVDHLLVWAAKEFHDNLALKTRGPSRGQMRAALSKLQKSSVRLSADLKKLDPITTRFLGSYLRDPTLALDIAYSAIGDVVFGLQSASMAAIKTLDLPDPGSTAFDRSPSFDAHFLRADKGFQPVTQFFVNVFLGLQDVEPFRGAPIPGFSWHGTGVSRRCRALFIEAAPFLRHFKSEREYASAAQEARRSVLDLIASHRAE